MSIQLLLSIILSLSIATPTYSLYLASATHNGEAKVWDLKTKKCIKLLPWDKKDNFSDTMLHPTNQDIVLALSSPSSELIKVLCISRNFKKRCRVLQGHKCRLSSIAYSQTKKNILASTSTDGTARVWDISEQIPEKHCKVLQVYQHKTGIYCPAPDPSDQNILAIPILNTITICNISNPCKILKITSNEWFSAVTFHPINPKILFSGSNEALEVWDLSKMEKDEGYCTILHTLPKDESGGRFPKPHFTAITFCPIDLNIIVAALSDGSIMVWDFSKQKDQQGYHTTLQAHTNRINTIAFHPTDSHIFASASCDGKIKIWNLSKQADQKGYCVTLQTHARAIAFFPIDNFETQDQEERINFMLKKLESLQNTRVTAASTTELRTFRSLLD